MGYYATKVEMSYEIGNTVAADDPEMIFFEQFKRQFGEDANIIGVGLRDSSIYSLENFEHFRKLNKAFKLIPGVTNLLSLSELKIISKDTAHTRFRSKEIFPKELANQAKLDSLMAVVRTQRASMGQLINENNGATMIVIFVQKEIVNSSKRDDLMRRLINAGDSFSKSTGIKLHYGGLPFIRTQIANTVKREMQFFLYLSVLITGLIMYLFFQSSRVVLFSMLIIGIVVVWVMGTLALFGYKITLLSGLIPPVIVTLGITNAIYLINKYHLEYIKRKE